MVCLCSCSFKEGNDEIFLEVILIAHESGDIYVIQGEATISKADIFGISAVPSNIFRCGRSSVCQLSQEVRMHFYTV